MKPGQLWPAAMIAVLALTVIANFAVLRLAHDPDAAIVEPDAYPKAVAWDSTAARRDASDALGWTAVATIGAIEGAGEAARAAVRVIIVDHDGLPIDGARVTVEAIHNREIRRPSAALAARGDGAYEASMPLPRAGLWELRVHADRAAAHFTTSVRADAPRSAP
jgi:nitrogen fixation protein FixH